MAEHIPSTGMVCGEEERENLLQAVQDFKLTNGRFTQEFERGMAELFGVRSCLFVNSGSSANLLALATLMQPEVTYRRVERGDEVITVACGFPTTVSPILILGCVPVYVDVTLPTYQVDVRQLERAWSPKVKAVMLAHTMGCPFDLDAVTEFCRSKKLWLIEDCCDAVGSTYNGRHVGSFGVLATTSHYPAHHVTTGEGGCVLTDNPVLAKVARSLASWGKDCWCLPGVDNTCGKRFGWQLGQLPCGFDHKYIFSRPGFNLHATEFQAAIGCAQLKKLPAFVAARKRNWRACRDALQGKGLLLPEATYGSDPSWFGFAVCSKERDQLRDRLEAAGVGTRPLFAGNLTSQPGFVNQPSRIAWELEVTDRVMRESLWFGVWPGAAEVADRIRSCTAP